MVFGAVAFIAIYSIARKGEDAPDPVKEKVTKTTIAPEKSETIVEDIKESPDVEKKQAVNKTEIAQVENKKREIELKNESLGSDTEQKIAEQEKPFDDEKNEEKVATNKTQSVKTGVVRAGGGAVTGIGTIETNNKEYEDESDPARQMELAKIPRHERVDRSNIGVVQGLSRDTNDQVAQVLDNLKSGEFPENISPFLKPREFDANEYYHQPEVYLNIVAPGRVFQSAKPGRGVRPIKRIGSSYYLAEQNKEVTLKVRAKANAPVTFTSFDLGAFENELTSMTVRANKKGIASVKFRGTPGTYNEVKILAASPLTSGRVRFIVDVLTPRNKEI